MTMSILELMHLIVREPAPKLPPEYQEEAKVFVDACLEKDIDTRKGLAELVKFPWFETRGVTGVDMKAWAGGLQ